MGFGVFADKSTEMISVGYSMVWWWLGKGWGWLCRSWVLWDKQNKMQMLLQKKICQTRHWSCRTGRQSHRWFVLSRSCVLHLGDQLGCTFCRFIGWWKLDEWMVSWGGIEVVLGSKFGIAWGICWFRVGIEVDLVSKHRQHSMVKRMRTDQYMGKTSGCGFDQWLEQDSMVNGGRDLSMLLTSSEFGFGFGV